MIASFDYNYQNPSLFLFLMLLKALQTRTHCCEHKMFLNKIRNIFCVPDTKCASATTVARARANGETFVSATIVAVPLDLLPTGKWDFTQGKSVFYV